MDFIEGKYSIIEVAYDEFEEGYLNYEKYVPYEDFGKDIWLLSCISDKVEKLDLNRIRDFIIDFIRSEDLHVINHIQLEKKRIKLCIWFGCVFRVIGIPIKSEDGPRRAYRCTSFSYISCNARNYGVEI